MVLYQTPPLGLKQLGCGLSRDWYFKYFWIYDITGNIKKYSKDDLSGLGFPNKINVTSNTDSLTISPQTVDVRNNSE